MSEKDIATVLSDKGQELKKLIKDYDANLEQWKFSVEETTDSNRVELAAKALIRSKYKRECEPSP